jgi:predicted SAM-dependent methyltransferase
MKLNLGCGSNRLKGWENHDQDVDITKPLPFCRDCADFILLEHCLEHVNGADGYKFMEEALRVLKPGGTLRICVPVLDRLDREHARDIITGHGHQMVYNRGNLVAMLLIAGFETVTEVTIDKSMDGHWRVIGEDKDNKETLRVEAKKKA